MAGPRTYDVIVVGSGQGGTALARELAGRGQRVALLERDRLGGSCVNYGCTPSKTLLAAAHAAGRARRAAELGIDVDVRPDFARVMERVRKIRNEWREGADKTGETDGLDVLFGEARFSGPRRLTVEGTPGELTAERIVINTGLSAVVPEVDGLGDVDFLTNVSFFELETLPPRTLVLGAGYIGLELGQALARLGSEVTVVDRHDRLLAREPERVAQALQPALEEDGMRFRLGRTVSRVTREREGMRASLDHGDELRFDALLVATGRTPNTAALDASRAGVELDEGGYVRIDDTFHTTAEGIFAIGDVARQPPFTHTSYEDHLRLIAIWDGQPRSRGDRVLAYAVYTDPQVGRVGLTSDAAKEQGLQVVVQSQDVGETSRGREWGHRHGFFELVAERGGGRLLGATFVGHEAAELVQTVLPLVQARLSWHALADPTFVHPTYGEALNTLAKEFGR